MKRKHEHAKFAKSKFEFNKKAPEGRYLCSQGKHDNQKALAGRNQIIKDMANTYTQMYVQIVFAVKGRNNLIAAKNRDEIEKYICGIIINKKSKPLAIYCNPDHIHVLIGLHPAIAVSDITRDIKANSSKFINDKKWMSGKFNWQDGFGAFTYSRSQIDSVAKYILNQPKHHRRQSFKEEYLGILKKLDIEFDELYLFEWYE